jgi:hypothetical protein
MTVKQRKALQARLRPVQRVAAVETYTRDGWLCQWCKVAGGRVVPHHRLRRSAGGRDEARCLVTVHVLCHGAIHDHPAEAKARGFLVSDDSELDRGWT